MEPIEEGKTPGEASACCKIEASAASTVLFDAKFRHAAALHELLAQRDVI